MGKTFSIRQAARLMDTDVPTVRGWIVSGKLKVPGPAEAEKIAANDLLQFAATLPGDTHLNPGIPEAGPPALPPILAAGHSFRCGRGTLIHGDSLAHLAGLPADHFQCVIADPPYYQVLKAHDWDNAWSSPEAYVDWTMQWASQCHRLLKPDGLFYIFGQLGKREHVWLHVCSSLTRTFQFHDMIIWDRAVGYNERYDSFTPQYEMILVLRKSPQAKPYFNKDAVRLPYNEATIRNYLRDNRYKDPEARETHLRKGKYATNILRVPSLKGHSREKAGHPSQKPLALIRQLIESSSKPGDAVLDPFLGSGTTAEAAERLERTWTGIESNAGYLEMARKRVQDGLEIDKSPVHPSDPETGNLLPRLFPAAMEKPVEAPAGV